MQVCQDTLPGYIQLHLLFTREAPKSRKPPVPSMQPPIVSWSPLQCPPGTVFQQFSGYKQVCPKQAIPVKQSQASAREERGKCEPQGCLWRRACTLTRGPTHKSHTQRLAAGTLTKERSHLRVRTGSLFRQGSTLKPNPWSEADQCLLSVGQRDRQSFL